MKKRLIATLIFGITMIYLSISVSAVGTFDTKAYSISWVQGSSNSSKAWRVMSSSSTTQVADSSGDKYDVWCAFITNQIIQDGYIIVTSFKFSNTSSDNINIIGVGQASSNAIPGQTTSYNDLKALQLNQQIIATTKKDDLNSCTVTITYNAHGYINVYPIIMFEISKIDPTVNILGSSFDLYESIEDAAGSGVTPEEMREVLSSWGEEELLPGIQDSVESGVQSGMQAALEDEKQQANTDGNSAIDELTGALDGVVGDINQAKEAFNTLGSALQYSGTSASLTFPGMNVPFLGQISEPINFDITGYIDSTFPPQLLLLIRCAFSIGIVSYPIFELVRQLRKLLDKG